MHVPAACPLRYMQPDSPQGLSSMRKHLLSKDVTGKALLKPHTDAQVGVVRPRGIPFLELHTATCRLPRQYVLMQCTLVVCHGG